MKLWVQAVVLISVVSCSAFGFFGLGVAWEREHVSKKATPNLATCSRCGAHLDKGLVRTYSSDGKPDILICPKCVYDQAASFLKFCPVEE